MPNVNESIQTVHTQGNIVSFKSTGKVPIRSMKVWFDPVQSGSGNPSPSNVRSISGWTGIDINIGNKSLLEIPNNTYYESTTNDSTVTYSNGYFTLHEPSGGAKINIPLKPFDIISGRKYRAVMMFHSLNSFASNSILFSLRGNGKGVVTYTPTLNFSENLKNLMSTVLEPSIDYHIDQFAVGIYPNVDIDFGTFAFEFLDVTDIETSIDWSSEAGTVYGGCVDLVSGELEATYAETVIDGTTPIYSSSALQSYDSFRIRYSKSDIISYYISGTEVMTDYLTSETNYDPWTFMITSDYFEVYLSKASITTEQEAIAYLNAHPLHVVYRINRENDPNPPTYQLTPYHQLRTLIGQNIIWSNSNSIIEVEYDLHEPVDVMAWKRRFAMNEPHLETKYGQDTGIATFNTDMKAPLKSCKVGFSPVQEGSGEPSPTNIRSISGHTGITGFSADSRIDIEPIDFEPTDIGGATLRYLGDGVFFVDGTVSTNSVVPIPIESFLITNRVYYLTIVKMNGFSVVNTPGLVFALSQGTTNKITTQISEASFINGKYFGFSNRCSSGYPDATINSFRFAVFAGESNVKFKIELFEGKSFDGIIGTNWANDVGTLYGGYVDLVKGELVSEYNLATANQNSTLGAVAGELGIGAGFRARLYTDDYQVLCDSLPVLHGFDPNLGSYLATETKVQSDKTYLYFYIIPYKVAEFPDYSSSSEIVQIVKDWMNENNLTINIVFNNGTKTIYSITPESLKSKRGTNMIWTEANGSTAVKYWTH